MRDGHGERHRPGFGRVLSLSGASRRCARTSSRGWMRPRRSAAGGRPRRRTIPSGRAVDRRARSFAPRGSAGPHATVDLPARRASRHERRARRRQARRAVGSQTTSLLPARHVRSGSPGHRVGGERRLRELLFRNLHRPHRSAHTSQVGRLGDLLMPEELGPTRRPASRRSTAPGHRRRRATGRPAARTTPTGTSTWCPRGDRRSRRNRCGQRPRQILHTSRPLEVRRPLAPQELRGRPIVEQGPPASEPSAHADVVVRTAEVPNDDRQVVGPGGMSSGGRRAPDA